jgi:hypothetical protein
MSDKPRYYVMVTCSTVRHMHLNISREYGKMRNYDTFACQLPDGTYHYFSDAHRIVRARRMALCAVFFVELSLGTNDKPAETFQVEINAVAV